MAPEAERERERQHGTDMKSLIETSTITSPEIATSSPKTDATTATITKTTQNKKTAARTATSRTKRTGTRANDPTTATTKAQH